MPAPYRPLSVAAFRSEIDDFAWTRRIWRVDLHHTGRPAHVDYRGLATIEEVAERYRQRCKHDETGQHITIAPDGVIWTGRDWNKNPASVGCGMNVGVFMVELIGNFDHGRDRLGGAQLATTLAVIDTVQSHFHLPVQALLFPREVPQTETTSPGNGIEKRDVLAQLLTRRHGGAAAGAAVA